MKALVILPLIALISLTAKADIKDCAAANKSLDGLVNKEAALKDRAKLILEDLADIDISPREAKARLDVDFQKITVLDDQINTIEKTCNGKYDLWSVDGDMKDAAKAAADEVNRTK